MLGRLDWWLDASQELCSLTMNRFWWPLLIIIQLLEPSRLNQRAYVEALLAFKGTVSSPQQLGNWADRLPCSRSRIGVSCTHKLKAVATFSTFPESLSHTPQSETVTLSPHASTSSPSQQVTPIQDNLHKSKKTKITSRDGEDLGFTTVTPQQRATNSKQLKVKAIVIGSVGAVLLVATTTLLVFFCLMRAKRSMRTSSETLSSGPSQEWLRDSGLPHTGVTTPYERQNLRQFAIEELDLAASKFIRCNVIGQDGFGLVYKGLLQDGSIVAIKRRLHDASEYFLQEVRSIGCIDHRHLVKLIGFCQDCHEQLLVYDYVANGNVGNHLYDNGGSPVGKLNIRQRLSIALGAAKGLEHLHSLIPPCMHKNFRTRNVLVDENFVAKVSDFGLSNLMEDGSHAESSSGFDCFIDPELGSSNEFSERSDVYSFGVFLLELISGREALGKNESEPQKNIVVEAKRKRTLDGFADKTLGEKIMPTMQWMMLLALQCVDTGRRRPTMKIVVQKLELVRKMEMGHEDTDLGEGIGVVTLGSDLFK